MPTTEEIGDALIELYGDISLLRIKNLNETAEGACILAGKKCGINPLARHLYALYHSTTKTWLSPSDLLSVHQKPHYEFRLRFKVFNVGKLSCIDPTAFDYYFQQVRKDFLMGNVPEIVKVKEKALGLAVTDMLRVKLEKGLSSHTIESDYKHYLPNEVKKQYTFLLGHFLKKAMGDALSKLQEGRQELPFVKEQYIQTILEVKPNYGCEEYTALMDEDGAAVNVILQMDPFHPEQPGLRKRVVAKKAPWVHMCSIEELCFISMRRDGYVEISRRNGVPQYFRFQNQHEVHSFVSLLDGYYRLTEKWTFNLCKELPTPSLQQLKAIKCHGPVDKVFAYTKLMNKCQENRGCYILREDNDYLSYILDVILKGQDKPTSIIINKLYNDEYQLGSNIESFATIQDLLSYYTKENFISTCIPPSEYDKSSLLLCKSEKSDYVSLSKDSSETAPLCVNAQDLILLGCVYEGTFTMARKAVWKRASGTINCCLKLLKPQYKKTILDEFLQMTNGCIFWHNEAIVSMLGFVIHPPALLMEFLPSGPLNKYLQLHKNEIKEVDLVEAATYLAKALWYLEEKSICHGNIRCSNILVSGHEANSFRVKLCDSSITKPDITQIHWIPPECYNDFHSSIHSLPADVWAFGTTLWEIFSYGMRPLEETSPQQAIELYKQGTRLPQPQNCDNDIYYLMQECWIRDPDSRKKPQAIMRDINQTLYEVHNSRRQNEYATVVFQPPIRDPDTISLSTVSSNNTENETIPDTPLMTERINIDLSNFTMNHEIQTSMDEDTFFDQRVRGANGSCSGNQNGMHTSPSDVSLPIQDQEWLIEMNQLTKLEKLGQGFYGEVYKAYLSRWSGLGKEVVAIKQLKSGIGSGLQDLLREITIMKTLHHKNIVEIKGVVEEPEMLLVMEFLPHSSLLVYLRTYKSKLTERHLIKFATDVAEGMEYIGQKGIVHRDLAARNILVASEDLVKISDFGLAQVMGPKDYYRLKTNRDLPIRWYAPETLQHWVFTHKSDVWSYGVTLWEMFTYGEEPVIEGCKDEDLSLVLESGTRLSCPPSISIVIYTQLMKPCWDENPDKRPTFTALIADLMNMQH